ncbi:uncharacterized protein LOC126742101 isoform X1 [Anthonomus grandis grandis]|uniref:uncharacterized protein LOC126742101 isoform X1 n=2 Tax=Anthonomus grandis grandis TaxID=2921223 RepID=UPI0021661FFB|nr:uncharacterized protein LOC126742101 isoform X1 [Anthonomus grandis grandis]
MAVSNIRSNIIQNLCKRTLKSYLLPRTRLHTYPRHSYLVSKRQFSVSDFFNGTAGHAETTSMTQGLSKLQAQELILRLNDEERTNLSTALHEYHSKLVKDELEGQLAASRWRSKYGRPAKLPKLGDVDPTGTYCPMPEDWLKKKFAESVPRPTTKNLIDIGIANSIPFIGFGFLDNFFMLIFGDYIDLYLGSYFCLTTMAAAALGNTLSDILGIGTAFYVERMANRIGFSPPKLSPIQMDMNCSRNAANLGRVLGVTIGCILGMCPLLFKNKKDEDDKNRDEGTDGILNVA